ncbi:MAG: EAL domain-containing protein [Gammaproteobacteria bacterium]|nr:EAL domain-containing protein [Gammaproteobacteria bacterium]
MMSSKKYSDSIDIDMLSNIGGDHKIRIAVVDDDDVDRERICRFLGKISVDAEIVQVTSGKAALALLKEQPFDILLLDYRLGDMTGTELLQALEGENLSHVPTIMITGMGDEKTAVNALKHGVHDYLPKRGLTAETLFSAMESALHAANLENKLREANENLRILSLYDSLTKLPNRNLFFDRLKQSILSASRNNASFAVLMIDLNLFKEVNDSLGHAAGDAVLAVIGDRLQAVARRSDTFARVGGDEFAAILHDVQTGQDALMCVEKISAAISQPIAVGDNIVQVGASIGIARYPHHGNAHQTLISNADFAMYSAKRAGRKYEAYQDGSNDSDSKIPVTQYLISGIRERQMFLEYQPKVSLIDNEVLGAEALIRWNHPQFGIIMPSNFIPMAERSDLICELTYLSIDMVFEQLHVWKKAGYNIPVAINISARMLDSLPFLRWMEDRIVSCGIDTCSVTLEITETTLASSSHQAYQILGKLSSLGFSISIDDFGSGFTSFKSIRNVEIDELKVDRMFVEKIQPGNKDHAIVNSMVSLAKNLGFSVVAEGVETKEQGDILLSLGCEYAQGYGIARPMPANALLNWIDAYYASLNKSYPRKAA